MNTTEINESIIESSHRKSWGNLIEAVSYNQLVELKQIFNHHNNALNKHDFIEAIVPILNRSELEIELLFEEIRKNSKLEVTWLDFLDFLSKNLHHDQPQKISLIFDSIHPVPHVKNDSIVKIVLIETERYFCYVLISKYGRIGLYDGNLNFLTTYHLIMTREDIGRKEEERRRRNRWVTDAVFCAEILMLIVTNSTRSITIYDAAGLKHVPLWLILTTPNIVKGLFCRVDGKNGRVVLYMGDDLGRVSILNFLQPKNGLLPQKFNDKINLFYWEQLLNEKDYVQYKIIGAFHEDSVENIEYFSDNKTLITCSKDQQSALVKYTNFRNQSLKFQINKGCNCFALSHRFCIIITGSEDGAIGIWNSTKTTSPLMILNRNNTGIIDVKIFENQQLFLTCSRDAVQLIRRWNEDILKLWNLEDYHCLQTIKIQFPSFKILGKLIEWGSECIYPGPKRECDRKRNIWERSRILIVCCNHLACIKLKFHDREIEDSFESPILTPPPLQNSVLIPKFWKTDLTKIDLNFNNSQIDNGEIGRQRLNELSFILDKTFMNENLNPDRINYKIACLERKKSQMRKFVEQGAPYLALETAEIDEIQLTPNLPIPEKKSVKVMVESLRKMMEDATYRDAVFSETSSSSRSPKSSRSSIVEFPY